MSWIMYPPSRGADAHHVLLPMYMTREYSSGLVSPRTEADC